MVERGIYSRTIGNNPVCVTPLKTKYLTPINEWKCQGRVLLCKRKKHWSSNLSPKNHNPPITQHLWANKTKSRNQKKTHAWNEFIVSEFLDPWKQKIQVSGTNKKILKKKTRIKPAHTKTETKSDEFPKFWKDTILTF